MDHDNFVQAVGGENGDFSGLLEVIDPEYCPDIPLNGESAGKKVPIKESKIHQRKWLRLCWAIIQKT